MIKCVSVQLCSLIYLILLFFVFSKKKKTHLIVGSIYEYLLLITLIGVSLDIGSSILNIGYPNLSSYTNILGKAFLIFIIIWCFFLTLYVMFINNEQDKSFLTVVKESTIVKVLIVVTLVLCVGPILLESTFISDMSRFVSYQTGKAVYFTYLSCFAYMGFIAVYIIYNPNKIGFVKRIPIFVFWFMGLSAAVIQWVTSSNLLVSPVLSFCLLFIYFTMENPDLKIINELEKDKEEVEEASKAKTDFLSNMSHDIRTPMNAIIGFSESLLMEDINEKQKNEVENIYQAANTLLAIINNILDVSRIESGKEEKNEREYEFRKVIMQLTSVITSKIDSTKVNFNIQIAKDVPLFFIGDELKIYQILMNLLSNAVKYTDTGHINFLVSSENIGENARVKFVVEDTGIGIKESDYNKLFVKFSRINNQENYKSIEGTGLGLVITKKLVELLGGSISFKSEYGKGTTFIVVIPQKISQGSQDMTLVNSVTKTMNAGNVHFDGSLYDILVVDDNELNLKVAERILQDYKFQITLAKSGDEAINLIKDGNRYDLIFLDHMMPVMDGIQTLHAIQKLTGVKIPPVVALTANAMVGMKEMYISEGFDGYISKPINRDELGVLLNNIFCKK